MRPGYLNGIGFFKPKRLKNISYDMEHEKEVGYLPSHVRDYKLFQKLNDPLQQVKLRDTMTFNILTI